MAQCLHRELRDYSLGQIAFAVFRVLFAITQLVRHVSALLTSIIITQVPVTFVTRSAKTDHVRTKIEIHFLAQLIAVLNSYPYTMSAMARLKWSAFLRVKFTAL